MAAKRLISGKGNSRVNSNRREWCNVTRLILVIVSAALTAAVTFVIHAHLHVASLFGQNNPDSSWIDAGNDPVTLSILENYPTKATATAATKQQKQTNHLQQQPEGHEVSSPTSSPHAYAFLLGRIDVDQPKYRQYFCGACIAIYLLRGFGSKADFVFYYSLKYDTPHDDLPEKELNVLRQWNVTLVKMPKTRSETFYNLNLNKFRILGLTQYSRVLFMDTDVMPLENLDYLFEYSESGILNENVVTRGPISPTNGGFFMLAPKEGDLQRADKLIKRKEKRYMGTKFSRKIGWGHVVPKWEGLRIPHGSNWRWYGASGDQGLLYYWLYFVVREFSLIVPSKVLGEDPVVETYFPHPTKRDAIILNNTFTLKCKLTGPMRMWGLNVSHPIADYMHFGGGRKPWKVQRNWTWSPESKFFSEKHFWWATLEEVSEVVDFGFSIQSLVEMDAKPKNHAAADAAMNEGLLTSLID